MKAECLRIASARLCLAMILALLVVPGYVVAPVLFAKADSFAQAGMLAGHIFHLANVATLLFAAALAFFWKRIASPSTKSTRWRWLLLALVVLMVAINEFALAPVMADLKQQMGPIDEVSRDDPQRKRFGMWHGISALLHMLASLAALLLVALGVRSSAVKAGAAV
ncbi:MAG: DUF4149 domain-containing protein [Mariprofundaceae bacterium]